MGNARRQARIARVEPSTHTQPNEGPPHQRGYIQASSHGIGENIRDIDASVKVAANAVESKYTDRLAFVKPWVDATGKNPLSAHIVSVSTSQQRKRSGIAYANYPTYRAKRVASIDSRETIRCSLAECCAE